MNRSYRKGSSRPCKMDTKLNRILGKSLAFEMENLMKSLKYIINIDETSASCKTTFNYTWLPKGGWGWVNNINFEGSKTTIVAIVSTTRIFFATTLHTTNNTKTFCKFNWCANKMDKINMQAFNRWMNNFAR